jgi:hypothetical protein
MTRSGVDPYRGPERRSRHRTHEKFPAMVHGRDSIGRRIKAIAVLENFSANGLYLTLAHTVEVSEKLFVFLRFSADGSEPSGPKVAIRGIVLRSEKLTDSKCGLAMLIKHHRFL